MPIAKPSTPSGSEAVPGGARKSDEWILYPNLMEQLTETRYEDGSARTTSTVLFFVENGWWKGCLNDRDNDRNAFFSAESFTALLVVIEDELKANRVNWKPKGGKRKK